jgi:hypothetical protein
MTDVNQLTQAFQPLFVNSATAVPGLTDLTLSVIASAHAGVQLPTPPGGSTATPGSVPNQFAITNTSTTLYVCVGFGATAAAAVAAAVLAGDGAMGGITVAPNQTRVVSVPGNPQFVSAIASGAGPTIVTVAPGNGR